MRKVPGNKGQEDKQFLEVNVHVGEINFQFFFFNKEVRGLHHGSDKTQTNKPKRWAVFPKNLSKIAGVPKTLIKRKLRLDSFYFSQNTLMFSFYF